MLSDWFSFTGLILDLLGFTFIFWEAFRNASRDHSNAEDLADDEFYKLTHTESRDRRNFPEKGAFAAMMKEAERSESFYRSVYQMHYAQVSRLTLFRGAYLIVWGFVLQLIGAWPN